MPAGLQVFDQATGELRFDSTSQLGRIVGSVSTGFVNGSVAADLSTGIPFAFAILIYANGSTPNYGTPGGAMLQPDLNITASGVSWTFPAAGSYTSFESCLIYYGVH
jgi:hypothetical protein